MKRILIPNILVKRREPLVEITCIMFVRLRVDDDQWEDSEFQRLIGMKAFLYPKMCTHFNRH